MALSLSYFGFSSASLLVMTLPLYSIIFAPLLMEIAERGGCEKLIQTEIGFRHGVYVYKGTLTSSFLGETFNLPYKDLDLLISAL